MFLPIFSFGLQTLSVQLERLQLRVWREKHHVIQENSTFAFCSPFPPEASVSSLS